MLEIRISDEALELGPSTGINITHSSPVFDPDSLDRKFTLPFNLPLTGKNKRIRRHRNRLDAGNKAGSLPAEVRVSGHLVLSGNMIQTAVNTNAEEVSIANDPLKIWERLRKIKINEILESFNLLDGRPDPVWSFGMGSTGSYNITVDGHFASATAATFLDIPTAGASIATQLNTAIPGIANYNGGANRLELDSFLVQQHPIDSWVLFTLPDYENIALYHYHAVKAHVLDVNATPIASHCFPMIRWDNFYGDKNIQWKNNYAVFNNVIDGVFLEPLNFTGSELLWWNSVLPCVRIPYILQKIADQLGYIWTGDVWSDTDFQKLIHVPNLAMDEVLEDIYDDLMAYKRNAFKTDIILNNLVPSMSAAEFITKICTTFNLYLAPVDGVLSLERKQTPMQVRPINMDGRIGTDTPIEPNTTDGWKLAMDVNTNELYSDPAQLLSVVSEGGEYEVLTAGTLFMMDEVRISPTHFARTPITNQPGRSPAFETSSNKSTMPLTLLFCHEIQPDDHGDDYILASHDGMNYDGDTVGAYSLSPEGEFGLYEKWHKSVIEYTVADSMKVTGYMHLGDLQRLTQWKSARIEFYHPEGSVIAAIKSIQASVTNNGLAPVRIELLYR